MPKNKNKLFAILCVHNFIHGNTILAKASFIKQCLPVPDSCTYHDWWFALCATLHNGILHILEPLILYRRHQDQATWDTFNPCGDKEAKFRRHLDTVRKNLESVQCAFSLSEKNLRILHDATEFNDSQERRGWGYLAYSFKHCGMQRTVRFFVRRTRASVKKAVKAALGIKPNR